MQSDNPGIAIGSRVPLWLATAVLTFLLIAACAAAAEFLLRRQFEPTAYYTRLPGWEIIYRPSPDGTPGITEDAHITINALGLRGEMPAASSSPRVLAVGGSTTEDILLNDSDTWTGQLQARLRECMPNAWVGNMGKSGTNARHHAIQLERILPRLPHIDRVYLLVGLNDMLFDSGLHHPKGLGPAWDIAQAFDYAPPEHPSLWQRSALVQATARLWSHLGNLRSAPMSTVRVVDFGQVELGYKQRFRQALPEDFIDEVPDISAALARYRAVLDRITATVARAGAQATFITQPFLWKEDMTAEELSRLYAGGVGSPDEWGEAHHKWFSRMVLARLLTSYNDVTRSVCAASKLACANLDHDMPKDASLYHDDFHYSKAGAARVAQIVSSSVHGDCHVSAGRPE